MSDSHKPALGITMMPLREHVMISILHSAVMLKSKCVGTRIAAQLSVGVVSTVRLEAIDESVDAIACFRARCNPYYS